MRRGFLFVIVRRAFRLIAYTLTGVLLAGRASGQIIYVDDSATGAGDGSSWCNGYVHLQDALNAATSNTLIEEIRIAEGTYKPDVGVGQVALSRTSTFQLINGVALRGGYAGCGAPNPDARNPDAYPTILTGDLAGNDVGDRFSNSRLENAYHVVTGNGTDSSAVLDGLIITAGRATGVDIQRDGGGLYNDGGSPTVTNCTFFGNYAARYGGAFRNWRSSSPTITDCHIFENSSDFGGGINNMTQSHPTITNCVIERNTVGNHGGGVYNGIGSAPHLDGCVIADNQSFFQGGGLANFDDSHPLVTNCRLVRNLSMKSVGGGALNDHSAPTFNDCVFEGNTAVFSGGGVSNVQSAPSFNDCTFRGNHANNGGGMINDHSASVIHNCVFDRNTVSVDGAAMFNFMGTEAVTISNCTFIYNIADRRAGGIFDFAHDPVIINSIFWDNTDQDGSGEAAQVRGGNPTINYSCVMGWTGILGGVGNHGFDPRFTSGPLGCFYLSQRLADSSLQSPCVDAGSADAAIIGVDARTTRRDLVPDAGTVDLGFHYAITSETCPIGNFGCHGRINLRDVAHIQQCFNGSGRATGVPCCEQFNVDDAPGVSLTDFALLAPALSNP